MNDRDIEKWLMDFEEWADYWGWTQLERFFLVKVRTLMSLMGFGVLITKVLEWLFFGRKKTFNVICRVNFNILLYELKSKISLLKWKDLVMNKSDIDNVVITMRCILYMRTTEQIVEAKARLGLSGR